jgi:hypothetical protein
LVLPPYGQSPNTKAPAIESRASGIKGRIAIIIAMLALVTMLGTEARPSEIGDQWEMIRSGYSVDRAKSIRSANRIGGAAAVTVIGGRPDECRKFPATVKLYCGCAAALKVKLPNDNGFWNLAANWFTLPRAEPGPNKAVVRPGHVKIITGGRPGAWEIYDPNSGGGLTRVYVTAKLNGVVVDPLAGVARAR